MKMIRKPTFAGKIQEKDERDIRFWAYEKTAEERVQEAWRLHCANHNVDPVNAKLDRTKMRAWKRDA